jgi:hypothetical protein
MDRLEGQRGVGGELDVVELSPHMRPAGGLFDRVFGIGLVVELVEPGLHRQGRLAIYGSRPGVAERLPKTEPTAKFDSRD